MKRHEALDKDAWVWENEPCFRHGVSLIWYSVAKAGQRTTKLASVQKVQPAGQGRERRKF